MGVEKFREENTCELLDTKRRSAADGTLKLLPYEGLENITALILFWAELLSTRAIPTRIALWAVKQGNFLSTPIVHWIQRV